MTIQKRVPMAGNMKKVAAQDLIEEEKSTVEEERSTVEGDGWTLTISKSVVDKLGEESIVTVIDSIFKAVDRIDEDEKED